jgi:hypothetical protein
MRRSGLTPNNIAIRQNQPTQNVQQSPPIPVQIQRSTQPKQEQPKLQHNLQTKQPVQVQSNRPNFSANLPSIRR